MRTLLRLIRTVFFVLIASAAVAARAQTNEPPDFGSTIKQFEFRYSRDARLRKDEEAIANTTGKALREVYRVCGIVTPPNRKVIVQFGSIPSGRNKISYALTSPRSYGSLLQFDAARCRQRNENPYQVYQHELVHVVMQCIMGKAVYTKFPPWIHEGVATYVGGHGPKRVNKFRRMGANIFNGLGSNVPTPAEYAEAYLAILYIDRTFGANVLRGFVQEIALKPTPWKDALKKATTLEWAQFEKNTKAFAVNYVAQLNNPNRVAQNGPPLRPSAPQLAPPQQQNPPFAQSSPPVPPVIAPPRGTGKPLLGIFVSNLSANETCQLPTRSGIMITAVKAETPADAIGLEAGDVLLTFDGRATRSTDEFLALLRTKKPGDKIVLQIFRGRNPISLNVEIGSTP